MNAKDGNYLADVDPDAIAALLKERYGIPVSDRLTALVDTHEVALSIVLESRRDRYVFRVQYLRGAPMSEQWAAVVDAADALFGSFVEQDRDYRQLPTGDNVEHQNVFFRVRIDRSRPELEGKADELLAEYDKN